MCIHSILPLHWETFPGFLEVKAVEGALVPSCGHSGLMLSSQKPILQTTDFAKKVMRKPNAIANCHRCPCVCVF